MNLLRCAIAGLIANFALLGAGGGAFAGPDHDPVPRAEASAWHSSDHARVRLIRAGLTPEGHDLVGVVFEMDEGWHTYWRSPGRLGLPPTFNWEGSENLRGVDVRWPLPNFIAFDGYETFGYEGRLVLPLEIARENPDEPMNLQLALGYAICETVCIPTLGFLAMSLPPREEASEARPEFVWAVEDALSRVPTRDLSEAGLEISPALLVRSPGAQRALRIHISSDMPLEAPRVILEGPKDVRFGTPKLVLDSTRRHLEALVSVHRTTEDSTPFGHGLWITVTSGDLAVEQALPMMMSGDVGGQDQDDTQPDD